MRCKNPINNSPFWYDPWTGQSYQDKKRIPENQKSRIEYWDSLLEFKVYERLCSIVPYERIHRQHTLTILPKNDYFPKWTWNIDFMISPSKLEEPIYIEAKGQWLISSHESKIFWRTLRTLEYVQPKVFQRILIIGNIARWYIPGTKIIVYPLSNLPELIKEIT